MVVFTCNNCGESLQKPKVYKHYQYKCHNDIFLTCVDCLKDFRGDEYVTHTKCITENERYGGKDFVPKASANKGEKKQQAWINIVQDVLTNSTNLTVPERNLLNSISRHENIPRKKAKFLNFIRNLSGNRVNMTIVENVWNKMETAMKEATDINNSNANKSEKQNGSSEENQNNSNICRENDTQEETNILNEIKDTETSIKKKKSKKRQLELEENDNSQPTNKKKNSTDEIIVSQVITEDSISKFSWKKTILEIVSAKEEVSLKKLRRKVVTQYLANYPASTSEKAMSKFEKKLGKVSNILVTEDKVSLAC